MQRSPTFSKLLSTVHESGTQHGIQYNRDITATSANCPEMTFVCWFALRAGGGPRHLFKMAGTVVLQLISFSFCCGKSLGKADSELKRFTSTRSVALVTKTNSLKQFARHEGLLQNSALCPLGCFS